jgi:sugar O-acyltransferase (sialic acid O-acetyltransferase NeuD family)
MVVAGASRHAKEIVELLQQQNQLMDLYFFDDINLDGPTQFYDRFPIIQSLSALQEMFLKDNRFILGLGGTLPRAKVAQKLQNVGGRLESILANTVKVGHFNLKLGEGLNVMEFVSITNSVSIGEGCLVNAYASIHHDVIVGRYCEISPRATLLGGAIIGDFTSIGSGVIVLPNVSIGTNVVVGAGAVVTKDIPDNSLVVGAPGKVIKELPPLVF